MTSEQRELIKEFLSQHPFCVLSYASGDKPRSAVIAFSETEGLEIIFGTYDDSRKYECLKSNPNVSVALGWDEDLGHTLQYEGVAEEMSGADFEDCLKVHLEKLPGAKKYVYDERERFFKIRPKWMRFTEYWEEPPKSFEINL